MSQKETLKAKRKKDLLQVSECFSPFKAECRVKEIVKLTGFSRKKVWELMKHMQNAEGVQQVKKGRYRALYPRLNELREKWGGEERKFTVNEFMHLIKYDDGLYLKEHTMQKPAILRMFFPLTYDIDNWKEEQRTLSSMKNIIYNALKECEKPSNFRAKLIFGCIYWEELEG